MMRRSTHEEEQALIDRVIAASKRPLFPAVPMFESRIESGLLRRPLVELLEESGK